MSNQAWELNDHYSCVNYYQPISNADCKIMQMTAAAQKTLAYEFASRETKLAEGSAARACCRS
jgi:hypothetical protein